MENEQIVEQNEETKKEFTHRPKWAFDSEYMTERLREVQFLAEKGIRHTFVRKTPDYNVEQYKYKKTPALFAALVEFYTRLELEKQYRPKRINKQAETDTTKKDDEQSTQEETTVSPAVIKQMQETLERYANQISNLQNKIQDDTE